VFLVPLAAGDRVALISYLGKLLPPSINKCEAPSIMQGLIILIALATAIAFSVVLAKSRPGRRHLLTFSVVDLVGIAAYETYMSTVWEKSVHAPIRLDILVYELPLLVLGVMAGIVGIYRSRTSAT
jgi:hypothetical protein